MNIPELTKAPFGKDFLWGVSTAAFQIEGSHDAEGKGLSIWDTFSMRKGKIRNGHDAQTACDFYNSYRADIALMRELGIPNFRFSLSWPRILPLGEGKVNPNGLAYYDRLIDCLLENGIDPWVTLYHWDLPNALEQKGGWTNRDVVSWFSDYTHICAAKFGDRVKNWMVMNEPSVFTGAGYFLGIHAPGKRGLQNYLKAIHHATLATGASGRAIRATVKDAHIGTTFSMTHVEPYRFNEKDIAAAKRVDALLNRTFIEPILGLGYPHRDLPVLRKINQHMLPEDEKNMPFDFDFIGLQCYTREMVRHNIFIPYLNASIVKAAARKVLATDMQWEVYPPHIYHLIKKLDAYQGMPKILVTENGAAFPDTVINGHINDLLRTKYIQDHLLEVLKAKQEGCNVEGYFVWSLMDNFEWAEGYHPRFGLIHVDYETQQRTVKQSGLWYSQFLNK